MKTQEELAEFIEEWADHYENVPPYGWSKQHLAEAIFEFLDL